jgi:hypothetical protein
VLSNAEASDGGSLRQRDIDEIGSVLTKVKPQGSAPIFASIRNPGE